MTDNIINDFLNSFKIRSKNCFYDNEHDPNEIALNGKCCIYVPSYMAYNIRGYKSKILNKPTYKDVFNLCQEYIKKTGNPNDRYFKAIYPPENNADNVDIYDYDINNIDEYIKEQKKPFILDPEKVYNIEMRMEGMGDALDQYLERNNIKLH